MPVIIVLKGFFLTLEVDFERVSFVELLWSSMWHTLKHELPVSG